MPLNTSYILHPNRLGGCYTTEYRPVIGITSEKSHAPIIEDWLNARGVLTQKPGEYAQIELSLNAETILVDPRSLNEAVKVELIKNFGRILDASTPEISINNLTDPIYYLDKNQRFTDLSTGEITVAPSWGIVVNNNEAEQVSAWLKQKELHPLTIVEKEENNTTFVVKDIYTRDRIRLELMQAFGEPIDVGTEAGYEQYSENYEKLGNANVEKPEATVKSEYQTQLENLFGQTVAPTVIDVLAAVAPNKELETVKGDLLQVKEGIVVQQVNCQGVMGGGLAQAMPLATIEDGIAEKYPQVKAAYKAKDDWQLGDVQFVKVSDKLFVVNVAGQDEYGTHQRQTDFEALRKGLVEVERFARSQNLPVIVPERLGSGLAGGRTDSEKDATWQQVQLILKEVLPDAKIVSKNPQSNIVSFPTLSEANKNTSLEILGKISDEKVAQLREHLETHYLPLLAQDKSNYAPGRQIAWVGAEWGLKDKDFKPAVQDDRLMELIKQVYPDAELALVTLSSKEGQGIGYHRDDSYANADARSINIGDAQWGYQTAKQSMVAYDPKEDRTTPIVESKLDSGTITRFNSKNAHAALHTSSERWSINIWSIKNNERTKFEQFQASNQPPCAIVQSTVDLTIKNSEWTPGGEIQVLRTFDSLTEAVQHGKTPANRVSIENLIEFGNQTATRAAAPQIPDNFTISGKPVPMNYELHNFNDVPQVPVNTTIEAMRGHGRVHTTRGVDYEKAYHIKSGDIALAVGKGGSQVAFRVGKQYEITPQMIQDPSYQKAWADWEKHSPKELTQNQALKGKIYGLFIEPLGDYVKGKIIPFPQVQQPTPSSAQVKQPPQREQWENNLIKTCFDTLKQNPENIGVEIQTAPLGSSTITFDTKTQTLAITNSAIGLVFDF
jgi:O-acetyl-ADP-ribose deacetylase (regulator of RNase III)